MWKPALSSTTTVKRPDLASLVKAVMNAITRSLVTLPSSNSKWSRLSGHESAPIKFNRPELPSDPAVLPALFPEIAAALREGPCRFSNCQHRGDPGCRVGTAWDRYAYYAGGLAELQQASSAALETRAQRPPSRPSRRRQRQQAPDLG